MKTPATEDATGLEIRSCTECGTQTDSRVIEKLPHTHNYVTDTKAATCTTDGYVKKTCACGSVINTVIPATGHKYGDAVVVKATCTKKGSSTLTCENCGHTEVTEIKATGHHYVESEKQAATCGVAGSVTYKCTNCNDSYTEPIEKLEHDLSKLRMQASTKEKILELFRRYGYEYEFRTSHVADVFHVKNSRANLVIRELTAAGILESPHYGTYRFYKTE